MSAGTARPRPVRRRSAPRAGSRSSLPGTSHRPRPEGRCSGRAREFFGADTRGRQPSQRNETLQGEPLGELTPASDVGRTFSPAAGRPEVPPHNQTRANSSLRLGRPEAVEGPNTSATGSFVPSQPGTTNGSACPTGQVRAGLGRNRGMRHPTGQTDQRAHAAGAFAECEVIMEVNAAYIRACRRARTTPSAKARRLLRAMSWPDAAAAGEVHALDAVVRLALRLRSARADPSAAPSSAARAASASSEWTRRAAERVLQKRDGLEDRRIPPDNGALNEIRVAGEVLQSRCARSDPHRARTAAEIRRRKRVVDDDDRAGGVLDVGDRLDVVDEQARIRRRLEPHETLR